MPVQRCQRNGESGWQYGAEGKCYIASEEGSDDEAKRKAYLQGAAIEGGGPLDEAKHMSEIDVPIIKRGIFNGMAVEDVKSLVSDTMKAMPYLIEAQQTGQYRGESNARFNTEPVPPFIHVRHYPNNAIIEKFKEWANGVNMNMDIRLLNAEEWGFVNFSNVDPDLAKLLAEGFPYRSGEFLPKFQNPDTGEVYPVVLRSVAFLGANTEPAVPQQPGYSVKLAQNESGVVMVRCDVPNTNQSQEEIVMSDKNTDTVKLSAEDIQRFEAMEKRLNSLESENSALKGAVNEMKEEKDTLSSQVLKFQNDAKASRVDAFCLKLEKDYNLTPAAVAAIKPVLSAENGIVKMSEDAEPVQAEQAYMQSIEAVLKLASEKNALFVPQSTPLPTGKQAVKKLSESEEREAAIKKLQADATERGEDLSYADARMKVVSKSNSILDMINRAGDGKEVA